MNSKVEYAIPKGSRVMHCPTCDRQMGRYVPPCFLFDIKCTHCKTKFAVSDAGDGAKVDIQYKKPTQKAAGF